mgnify:FL=1
MLNRIEVTSCCAGQNLLFPTHKILRMIMTLIYNIQDYITQKDDKLRLSHGCSKWGWNLMKECGYDVSNSDDVAQFFRDLEEDDA